MYVVALITSLLLLDSCAMLVYPVRFTSSELKSLESNLSCKEGNLSNRKCSRIFLMKLNDQRETVMCVMSFIQWSI